MSTVSDYGYKQPSYGGYKTNGYGHQDEYDYDYDNKGNFLKSLKYTFFNLRLFPQTMGTKNNLTEDTRNLMKDMIKMVMVTMIKVND